jgi:hypothetical protein
MPVRIDVLNTDVELIRKISRREVDAQQQSMVGITASLPRYVDIGGFLEFVVDVRVGTIENQGLVKDVLIASWVQGLITDFNVPVLMQRSEGGRLAIIGRAEVRLPDVALNTYSYGSLGIPFASNLSQRSDGTWEDGFGYPANDPNSVIEVTQVWVWQQGLEEVDDLDPGSGEPMLKSTAGWVLT